MASVESAEQREERLRRRRERDRLRRERETEEERQARLARRRQYERIRRENVDEHQRLTRRQQDRRTHGTESDEQREARLARRRENYRRRRDAMNAEHSETALEDPRERHQISNHSLPSQFRNLAVDDPEITRRIQEFYRVLTTLENTLCNVCLEQFPSIKANETGVCNRCQGDSEVPRLYSAENNMDPGPVPPELCGLSQAEEMLISRVLPIMSIYRLPRGQYGYSGHILNLPQDVTSFINSLPRCPATLDVIVVRREGAGESHRDFRVHRSVVLTALQWLVTNNIYYHDVTINHETLALLPDDSDLTNLLAVHISSDQLETPPEQESQDDDPHSAYLHTTFVPTTTRGLTEQQRIQQSILDPQNSQHANWPSTAGNPINEFTTEGYICCAFPVLFPTGAADFLAPRQRMVTIGNYFKHLMLYHGQRFAKHPRFRYFALNTQMRHRALQNGRIYVRQNPDDGHLSVDELRDMVGHSNQALSNRVLHFGATLRGTRQFWQKQRSRLTAMVDTLGLPTLFFTLSAADLQWPELANLLDVDEPQNSAARSTAVVENPCMTDWFFYHRVIKFMDVFFIGILKAEDYWLRFEYQHRGSPHVHGVAWLHDAPDVQNILATDDLPSQEELIRHIDTIVSTINPAVLRDGSNSSDAPPPKVNPHICNKQYLEVEDHHQDLSDLIATCQRHTRCSTAYCLRNKNGVQQCRFNYPKPLQAETVIVRDETGNHNPTLITARNDGLVNSHNPIQLSAWRGNVDMQYCVCKHKVIEYITKYATKCEPRSETMKEVFTNIVQNLKDDSSALQVVQKLLINSVGERDLSAQETCHLLLQLPLVKCTRDYTVLSLDGSRQVQDEQPEDSTSRATVHSMLDHYVHRPSNATFEDMALLHFAQNYSMPRELGTAPKQHKMKILSVRPYCSPDPNGPKYEQYCQQKLMLHVPFRSVDQLKGACERFSEAYSIFLSSANVPPSLEDDIRRLTEQHMEQEQDANEDFFVASNQHHEAEEWMLICRHNPNYQSTVDCDDDHVWSASSTAYTNLDELPTFIATQRQSAQERQFTTTADPANLQGKQLATYNLIKHHLESNDPSPIHMIVSGTAGTGKSYLIHCLRLLLHNKVHVVAPTGVAAYNVDGNTLHSFLCLPTRAEFKDLEGEHLNRLQQSLAGMQYMIIDEISMVGRKLFGQVDRRLRQVFPQHSNEPFGGCSCLLFGDFGQLPPVMDLPLYTTSASSSLSDIGSNCYQAFDRAVVLEQVMRQAGHDPSQVQFRNILLRLRNCEVTESDWRHLMTRTPAHTSDSSSFNNALHLFPTVEAVVEHNINKLYACGQPVATIKAVHTGPNVSKASPDDTGGLHPVVCLAKGARVMLSANLWVDMGLVNGAMGSVQTICYREDTAPPDLPVAVTVLFDNYSGPTLPDGTVPIIPLRRSWSAAGSQYSRLQLPLKLSWAVTIHKAQGLTLDKVTVDIGKKEFCSGLTFVAISRVRQLKDLLLNPPFPFQRLRNLSKSRRTEERKNEQKRLQRLETITFPSLESAVTPTCRMPSQVYEEQSTHSLPSQWMDQATPSLFGISEATSVVQNDAATPFSCGMDGTTPSPLLDYCKDKDVQATPSPYGMDAATPSPYGMDAATPSPDGMDAATPSPYGIDVATPSPYGMDTDTPSPLLDYCTDKDVQATPSPFGMDAATPSSLLDNCMDKDVQAISSPPSQCVREAIPSPRSKLSHLINEATPPPPLQSMREATPSPKSKLSHWMNEGTPSPPIQFMREATPSPRSKLSHWMNEETPSPLIQCMREATSSPSSKLSHWMNEATPFPKTKPSQ